GPGARSAPSGGRKGVRGNPGSGGFPPRCLHLPRSARRGPASAHCRAQRGALGTFHGHRHLVLLAPSAVIGAAASHRGAGWSRRGVWRSEERRVGKEGRWGGGGLE